MSSAVASSSNSSIAAGKKKRKAASSSSASSSPTNVDGDENNNTSNTTPGGGEQVIDYTPHYEVLVKEGATHFDSISAAIFEHIDNSITAFKGLAPEKDRQIEVQIHAPSKGE